MTAAAPPAGYERVESGDGRWAAAAPEVAAWVRERLAEAETLHAWAARVPGAEVLRGRGPAYVVPTPAGPGVVRRYLRGGAVAPLLGDRYLRAGTPRPVRELRASDRARARGVETPRALAAGVYPAGVFYRGDLVTEYVPRSLDLGELLFGPEAFDGATRRAALEAASRLVEAMAAAGVVHPDLNAKNVLLDLSGEGPRAILVDLDRCRVRPPPATAEAAPMRRRLLRSLEKLGAARGRPLADAEWAVIR